jgi:DNA polymerase-4
VLDRRAAFLRFRHEPPGLLPGIGPKTAATLGEMGITTIDALARMDADVLAARFGPRIGPWLVRRAQFDDDSPVTEVRIAVSESRETTFDEDIADREELERVLERLVEQLCSGLAKQERRGRTIGIKVRLDDFTTATRARTLPEAVNEPERVGSVALDLLREYAPPRPVRLLGVRVASFDGETRDAGAQLALPVD